MNKKLIGRLIRAEGNVMNLINVMDLAVAKTNSFALNGICYVDDRQVVDVRGKKFFGKPHVIIEVEELP